MKFYLRVRLKRWNDQEFERDRAKSENNITENLFALGHETHNRALINNFKLYGKYIKFNIFENIVGQKFVCTRTWNTQYIENAESYGNHIFCLSV